VSEPSIIGDAIQGMSTLEERFNALIALGVSGEEIRHVLRPGAELIAKRWRDGVPEPGEFHPYATGQYHDGIEVGPTELGDEDFGIGWNIFTNVTDEEGFNYPEALEMGTSTMAAWPSAQPAFDESADEVIVMAEEALDLLIQVHGGGV
jgi:hypothetical protein